MYFNNYDDKCIFYTSLQVVPREFEKVSFPFIKAKVGIDWFWVKTIEHDIAEESIVTISLKGGSANKYR